MQDLIDKLHTTPMGAERIRRNLQIETEDVVGWCRERILDKGTRLERIGKNWYAAAGDCRITINAYSGTIITAHKIRPVRKGRGTAKAEPHQ